MLLSFNSSIQRDLDRFFKRMNKSDFSIREVTKSAFTQCRAKLNPEAFKDLNKVAIDTFYSSNEVYTWNGMRTLSVDGSRLVLPDHPTVVAEFGSHNFGPDANCKRSLALCSILYDVLNHVCLDSQIAPFAFSERELLYRHMNNLMEDDLLLLDRGYPSIALFFMLHARGVHFCIRMKDNWWLEVNEFVKSKEIEKIISFKLPKKDHKLLHDFPEWIEKEIQCRLIKIKLPDGNYEILCTSLTDAGKFLFKDFEQLYHYRWQEEEAYKLLKSRIEIENFTGKTALAVKQDFFAKVMLMTLCAAYAFPIEDRVIEEYHADKNRKHSQKINRTNALSMTRDILVSLFVRKQYKKAFAAFDENVSSTREIIRPDRSEPRNKRVKQIYSANYKRL